MSRSQPQAQNPATRFMEWKGDGDKPDGEQITYYQKTGDGEGENVIVPMPFKFLVLNELHTITGYSESDQSGFWSNEVLDLKNGILVVRTKRGIFAQGTYADIQAEIKAAGAKYTKSVYIGYYDDTNELVIGHFKFAGAALTAWIEFQKTVNVEKVAVEITGTTTGKKGKNTYYIPVFKSHSVKESTDQQAIALDRQLWDYLNTYFDRGPDTTNKGIPAEDIKAAEESADENEKLAEEAAAALDAPKTTTAAATTTAAPAEDEIEDKPIDLADVPF